MRRLDFASLTAWLGDQSLVAVFSKTQRSAYYRASASGSLSVYAADKLAAACHAHPFEIWPDWFSD